VGTASSVYFSVPFATTFASLAGITVDFAVDKASVDEAARNGKISKIHYIDLRYRCFVGCVAIFETIVHGE
jgi:hypothetical protein